MTTGISEDAHLTIEEAAGLLDPPISPAELAALVEGNGLQPVGTRRKLSPGRPARTYSWSALARIHAANAPLRHMFACPSGV
jgi:hypothetical protein